MNRLFYFYVFGVLLFFTFTVVDRIVDRLPWKRFFLSLGLALIWPAAILSPAGLRTLFFGWRKHGR